MLEGLRAGGEAGPTDEPGPSQVHPASRGLPRRHLQRGGKGARSKTEEPGRHEGQRGEGRLEAERAACSGLLPASAGLPGNQRPLLPQGCVANTRKRQVWGVFSATDVINQETSLMPELPQIPFDLIIHNHRRYLLISTAVSEAAPASAEGGNGQAPAPAGDRSELPGASACLDTQSTTPSHLSFRALSYRSF